MTQKFYTHDATTTVSGTLPGSTTLNTSSPNVTASGASTNRAMDGTIGTSQVSAALTTLASTSAQKNWARRHISPPLKAGTYGSGTWTFSDAQSESNANSNLQAAIGVWFWRPSTGAKVGTVANVTQTTQLEPGTTETARSGTISGSNVTILDGDVLVVETWGFNTQGNATARTNTWFYDGTTEASSTSNAAFIQAPADIPLQPVNTTVTPGVLNLTTTKFAPTIRVGMTVKPGLLALTTATFAPTVKTPVLVTPGLLSLTLSTFAPSVKVGVKVQPALATLTLSEFAPTVLAPQLVTPGLDALTLSGFAPAIGIGVHVTADLATLGLTTFAPTVTATGSDVLTAPVPPKIHELRDRIQARVERRKALTLLYTQGFISTKEYIALLK